MGARAGQPAGPRREGRLRNMIRARRRQIVRGRDFRTFEMRTESRERDGEKRKETERWKQGKVEGRSLPFPPLPSFLASLLPSSLPFFLLQILKHLLGLGDDAGYTRKHSS